MTSWFLQKMDTDFGKIADPFYKAIKQCEHFSWSRECESAVEQLKQAK